MLFVRSLENVNLKEVHPLAAAMLKAAEKLTSAEAARYG
jgi:hypothetical protein